MGNGLEAIGNGLNTTYVKYVIGDDFMKSHGDDHQQSQLHAMLISSGQTYGTNKAVAKKTSNKTTCNLSCLQDDIYKMSKYFYSIGANVSVHHNNAPKISEVKQWITRFLKTASGKPKVIYYTGHGDRNGNLCFDDGELSFEEICNCGNLESTVIIKDCCYAGQWGEIVAKVVIEDNFVMHLMEENVF